MKPPHQAKLAAQITDFIAKGGNEAAFNTLAQAVFRYQFENNAPYRRFCEGRGIFPANVVSWRDIPAAPAVAFKRFALTCLPEAICEPREGGRVFHSSGTTGSETSRHYLDKEAVDIYRLSLRAGYRRFVLPDGAELPVLALMTPPEETPHSSLSFMLGELIGDYSGEFFADREGLCRLSVRLASLTDPVVLFGTAFAFVHFFDSSEDIFALPEGSRVVETGGFKGRSREVSKEELYGLFTSRLGVPATHCLSEYGMSEMASQFYDSTLMDHFRGVDRLPRKVAPPTLRTRVLDPVTGREAVTGEPGLLAHFDLANLNSVLAIQTEDLGYTAPDSEGFTLLGRAPGAVLRGCSLTAEDLLQLPDA